MPDLNPLCATKADVTNASRLWVHALTNPHQADIASGKLGKM